MDVRTPPLPRSQEAVVVQGTIPRGDVVSRGCISAPSLSIPHLREALHSLESRMASLLSERELLESRLEQAVRLQSPIHRLPEELLSAIFEIGVMDGEEEDTLMLANLMLVCRNWRDVAVNTPMLWSRVVAGAHHSMDRAQLKLERSKSVPLHVRVDFGARMEYGSVSTQTLVNAMDMLRPSIWRWKTFDLTVPNRPQAYAVLTRCKERAPLLEAFSVRVCHPNMQEDQYSSPPLPLFDGRTPRLHSCSFTSYNFGWDLSLVSRLQVLKLGGYWNAFSPSVDVILNILRACPQLEELALRNMSDVNSHSDVNSTESDRYACVSDSRTVHLPRLTKASFYYCGNVRAKTVLSKLSFPALECIEFSFLDNVSPMVEQLLRQSLSRLPLRRLRIESSFLNELKLVKLLRRLPSLTTLEFVDIDDISPNLLKTLSTPATSHTWTCPKLTTLCLEGCTTLDWESLRSVVESRLPAQTKAFPRRPAIQATPPPPLSSRTVSKTTSSASAYAAHAHILSRIPAAHRMSDTLATLGWPYRLDSLNLTRCHQISKEMVQWLRMYVAEVKCESAPGVWGELSAM
ncbi:hypothetical protein WOLCODRAFT_67896 [Wolfiporia cocos MD-104 SS10]|uniref:F-box domain-containing protein n=1 Tax=Wolfiporia cocos (strain MD-104) TaxID=742152 RepID=A0A2H3JFA4_WOLCO|nr:hypothetical protein WOLCODRAFT_67896 [Wolfiporia cocos MD-104 SS10]